MKTYFEEVYQRMGKRLIVRDKSFLCDNRFFRILEFFKKLPKGKLLDMGCGQGAILNKLKNYHEVRGLEFDRGALKIAASKGLSLRAIDLNRATTVPFRMKFDYILISEVCEHLLDPRNAMRLAFSCLKPGGYLLVTVPNAIPLFVRVNTLLGRTTSWIHYPSPDTEATGHLRFFTADSLRRLGEQVGFKHVFSRGLSWRFNGPFWGKIFYHTSRFTGGLSSVEHRCMLLDDAFSRAFPSLSPGLMAVFTK